MPDLTMHFSSTGGGPALCGSPQATRFSASAGAVTCPQCRARQTTQHDTPLPFTKTN